MALPNSRNTTYVPGSPVLSADLNDLQDQIIALDLLRTGVLVVFGAAVAGVPQIIDSDVIGGTGWVIGAASVQVPAADRYWVSYSAQVHGNFTPTYVQLSLYRGGAYWAQHRHTVAAGESAGFSWSGIVNITDPATQALSLLIETDGSEGNVTGTTGPGTHSMSIRRIGSGV